MKRTWFVEAWVERRETASPVKPGPGFGDFVAWALGGQWSDYVVAKTRRQAVARGIAASGLTGRVHARVVERHRAKSSRQEMRRTAGYWGTRRERQARPYRCAMGAVHDGRRM